LAAWQEPELFANELRAAFRSLREVVMSSVETGTQIRPFHIEVTEEQIADLRRRIAATRWPTKELVDDRSQGVQLATLKALADYWTSEYDFGRVEARLNTLPQFTTEIDGVEIHFIHVRSQHEDALPLIMTHGWPGSVIELLETISPLTDPTAHGGSAGDAFHLVLPSLPGYGFSGEPAEIGWYTGRVAQAWAELMHRLGYSRYVAQGGDQGAAVTDDLAHQGPEGLIGVHLNLLRTALGSVAGLPAESEQEQAALEAVDTFRKRGFGYFLEQSTRPQTIAYALLDSPVALAAWMLDHDTDSYNKISRAFVDGQPAGGLTRDRILDNVTLYWLTGTGASAARSYWEGGRAAALAAGQTPPAVTIPVGFTTFPGEIFRAPRSWVDQTYPSLVYFNEADKGGHFAAWEEPQLFAEEMRAAFAPLREGRTS
jgi:pimeloyl-ACP methyl ester carboxylesterase